VAERLESTVDGRMRRVLLVLAVAGCGGTQQSMVSCSTTHSSVMGGSPEECSANFACFDSGTRKNTLYDVQCTRPTSNDNWRCDCIETGVIVKSFVSIDFCAGNDPKAAAATGCGWRLE
jgi:hypothetical protein